MIKPVILKNIQASLLVLSLSLLLYCLPAKAGFRLPEFVFTMKQMDTVEALAASDSKAVSFVYTDKTTGCGLCRTASMDVFNTLGPKSIVVYVDRKGFDRLPEVVMGAMKSAHAGRFIPKTVITDPRMEKIIAIIPYKRDREERIMRLKEACDLIDDELRSIREENKSGSYSSKPSKPTTSTALRNPTPANQVSKSAAAATTVVVLIINLNWKTDVTPPPDTKASFWFLKNGINIETIESEPGYCSIRVRFEEPGRNRFEQSFENYMKKFYKVRKTRSKDEPVVSYQFASR